MRATDYLDELKGDADAALAINDPARRAEEVQRVTLRYLAALSAFMHQTDAAVRRLSDQRKEVDHE